MSHDFARSQRLKKESPTRKKPARKKSGGVPSWLWVLVGTLAGFLIMFLVYLSGLAPVLPGAQPQDVAPAAPAASQSAEPAAPPKRVSPVFEFYTKLPEGGQPVTDIPPAAQPAPPADAAPPPAAAAEQDPIQQLLAQKEAAAAQAAPATAKPEVVAAAPAPKAEATAPVAKTAATKPEATKPEAAKPVTKGRYLQVGAFRNKAEVDKLRAKISLLGLSPSVQGTTNAKGESLQKVMVGPFSSADDMDDARIILNGNGINSIPVN